MGMTPNNNGYSRSKQKSKKGSEMFDKYVKPVEEERRKSEIQLKSSTFPWREW